MTAAQEAAKQRIRSERIYRKTQRLGVLSTLLEMHEGQNGSMDIIYVKGLKFRIQKCRNELRNMGARYTVPPIHEPSNGHSETYWWL